MIYDDNMMIYDYNDDMIFDDNMIVSRGRCSPRSCSSLATSSSSPRSLIRTWASPTFTSAEKKCFCWLIRMWFQLWFCLVFVIVETTNIVIVYLCFNSPQPFNFPLQFVHLLLLNFQTSSSSGVTCDHLLTFFMASTQLFLLSPPHLLIIIKILRPS